MAGTPPQPKIMSETSPVLHQPQNVARQPVTLEMLCKRSAYADRFKEVLGKKAPAFISSLIAVGRSMPDVEPNSIVASAMTAAVLDLPIEKSLGFAWIVPYREGDRKYAQFQLGVKGFIQLAQRSGSYSRMNARAVNVEAFKGYDDVGEPIIDWSAIDPAKEPIGYVFAFKLTNGFSKVCFWTTERVRIHAQRYSQAFRKGYGPWKDNFEAMALKTVIKNELSDWGILSVEFQTALLEDQGIRKTPDDEVHYPDSGGLLPIGPVDDQRQLPPATGEGAPEPKPKGRKRAEKAPEPGPAPQTPPPPQTQPQPQASATVAAFNEPEGGDDGDLGPQTEPESQNQPETSPEPQRGRATMVEGKASPQDLLEDFVVRELGCNFDTFRKWGMETGMIEGADSLGSFQDIGTKLAERLLRAKIGLQQGLEKMIRR